MRSVALRVEHRQQQALSPRLQQAVRLLQLSSLDFAQEVHDALAKNPFLESDESDTEPPTAMPEAVVPGVPGAADAASATATQAIDAPAATPSTEAEAEADAERDVWQADGTGSGRRGEDGDLTLMDMMAVETSLADHLHSQLNVLPLSLRDLVLAKAIVESLDDDGYLRSELAELIEVTDMAPPATLEELQIALRRVQALEPAGIAARNVRECLLLQLPTIENERERELAHAIVAEHLESLAAKDMSTLSKQLSLPVAQVEEVCARIRRLDPRPGWRFGASNVQYVTPDVIVRKTKANQWITMLNPDVVPKVRLNQMYAELFQQHRDSGHAELASHLREARWTVRNVEQRFSTILDVADAIVRRQKHFFDFGPLAMKPLGLREIAEELGLHESTVCRVTNNKYMATPSGVFELKYFFSRALPTPDGGAASATAIRGMIRDMIEAESPADPLSDAQIARQLARQGYSVARRTVTKYRQMMKLPAVEKRRRHS